MTEQGCVCKFPFRFKLFGAEREAVFDTPTDLDSPNHPWCATPPPPPPPLPSTPWCVQPPDRPNTTMPLRACAGHELDTLWSPMCVVVRPCCIRALFVCARCRSRSIARALNKRKGGGGLLGGGSRCAVDNERSPPHCGTKSKDVLAGFGSGKYNWNYWDYIKDGTVKPHKQVRVSASRPARPPLPSHAVWPQAQCFLPDQSLYDRSLYDTAWSLYDRAIAIPAYFFGSEWSGARAG